MKKGMPRKASSSALPLSYLIFCLFAMLTFISMVSYVVFVMRAAEPETKPAPVDMVGLAHRRIKSDRTMGLDTNPVGVGGLLLSTNINLPVTGGVDLNALRKDLIANKAMKRDTILKGLHDKTEDSHFIILGNLVNGAVVCPSASMDTGVALPGIPVAENVVAAFTINATSSQPYSAQLCLAKHVHFHTVELKLSHTHEDVSSNHCNLFISLREPNPSRQRFDFKADKHSTTNSITLHTYMDDFVQSNSNTLYISIHAHSERNVECEFGVRVSPVSVDELIKISPLLRGGVVPMERDIMKLVE
jgi:hypothetical protein